MDNTLIPIINHGARMHLSWLSAMGKGVMQTNKHECLTHSFVSSAFFFFDSPPTTNFENNVIAIITIAIEPPK